MEQIRTVICYPVDFKLDSKEILLNQIELTALMNSREMGSEGKYFKIERIIFEDISHENEIGEIALTVLLENL